MSDQVRNSVITAIRLQEALALSCDGSPAGQCRSAMHMAIARSLRAQAGLLIEG